MRDNGRIELSRVCRLAACLLVLTGIGAGSLAWSEATSEAEKHAITVLNTATYFGLDWDIGTIWRYYETWQSDVARLDDGKPVTVDMSDPRKKIETAEGGQPRWVINEAKRLYGSPPPPEGWQRPEFDDSGWLRHGGPFPNLYRSLSSVCVRGKFQVKDPARVSELTLSVKFQGGVIVYLNGVEIGRSFIPAGKMDATTLAEPYPSEAYLNSKGGLMVQPPYGEYVLAASKAQGINYTLYDQETLDHFKQRGRTADIQIPASALKKGLNVLAVEVRRAPADPIMFTKTQLKLGAFPDFSVCWNRAALEQVTLAAVAEADAVTPNLSRPEGVQVWNEDVCARINCVRFGDPSEPLRSIRLCGLKNGAYSGRVVVGSRKGIQGLSARVTDLRREGGGVIPASVVQIAYGNAFSDALDTAPPAQTLLPSTLPISYGRTQAVAALPKPVADAVGAVVPIWVTVKVPRDVPAGAYAGSLTIILADAKPIVVPIELNVVGDWVLPDPQEFTTFIGIHESADSVAMHYNVPVWSEEHWKHLDRIYELLGQIGTKDIYLTGIAKTHLANEQSMIRWIRQPDGSYTHDFSILERYLDLALKHLGKVPVVCLYLHDYGFRGDVDKRAPILPCVTQLDPKTGKLSELVTPEWGTPAAAEFWKPVIDRTLEIVAKRGLRKSFMFGVAANNSVNPGCLRDLKTWYPDVPWVNRTHYTYLDPPQVMDGGNLRQPVGLSAVAMGAVAVIYDAEEEPIHPGWKSRDVIINFARWDGARGKVFGRDLPTYRVFAEGALLCGGMTEGKYQVRGSRGVGHIGADYWPVMKDPKGGPPRGMTDRYTFWHSLSLSDMVHDILAPGIRGPVSTARHQLMRESLQDAEALVFVENALLDQARRAGLDPDLARRAKQICDERIRMLRHFSVYCGYGACEDYARVFPVQRWLGLSEKLYAAADEVQKALGKQ
jgi:hypothetical protein